MASGVHCNECKEKPMRTFIILAMAIMLSLTSNAQHNGQARGGYSRGGNGGRSFAGSRVSVSVGRSYNGGSRYVSNYRGGYGRSYGYSPYRSGFGYNYYAPRVYAACDPYYDNCYGYDPYYYAAPRVVRRVIVPVSPYAVQGGWRRFGYR